jgi:peptidoglycan/xylan/chitin deacetylase (PgdA/CDA1 family)
LWASFLLGMLTCVTARAASAGDCPGHPDAIGTSRTLVVDPREHPIIGTMQYAKTLPLEDHEVVLTFDDGPLPKYSNQILDIPASHCANATFFLVGRQGNANPEGLRKVMRATRLPATPRTIPGMHHSPIERAKKEIEDGIASIAAALADGTALRRSSYSGPRARRRYRGIFGIKGHPDLSADFRPTTGAMSPPSAFTISRSGGSRPRKGIPLLHDISCARSQPAEDPA